MPPKTSVRYIDSSSKNFYKSEFPDHGPDGPVEIPLPARMRVGGISKKGSYHSDNQGRARIRGKANSFNPPSKVMVVANAYSGHAVMMTRDMVLAKYGITMGFA